MWRCLAFGLIALSQGVIAAGADRELANLRAFTKLYGYVRYFHPSDEAQVVDWDKFATFGAAQVLEAKSNHELSRRLEDLFLPVAPSLELFATGGSPNPTPRAVPDFAAGIDVVAWRHRGVGLGFAGPYASARSHRTAEQRPVASDGFGTITQVVPALAYRGRNVRLRAAVKAAVRGADNRAQLWLRIDRPNGKPGFFDNMERRPIRSITWQTYEIIGEVAEDAERIVFGGFLKGMGVAWFDAFVLEVEGTDGTWSPIPLHNPSFEANTRRLEGWASRSVGYAYAVDRMVPFEGENAAVIETVSAASTETFFEALPEIGESLRKELIPGIHCRIPLALYGDREQTYPIGERESLDELSRAVDAAEGVDVRAVRIGAVVILWNIIQHFYPYFDVVRADWDRLLSDGLTAALRSNTGHDFYQALRKVTAPLQDGHLRVYHRELERDISWFPISVDWVEDRLVVTRSEQPDIEIGDVIQRVDDEDVFDLLKREEALVSGSPQWRRYRVVAEFGRGPKGSVSTLSLERGARSFPVELARVNRAVLSEPRRPAMDMLGDDIHYVDLTRVEMKAITERIEALASARGVVFDLRGYPAGNHGVIHHLIDEPIWSAKWMVPQIIYPDQQDLVGYDTSGRWNMTPKQPRIQGRVVFLTDARAISYAESFLGIIEHYHLAQIVGQPTAGTNGNVNRFALPGGFQVTFTGMRVLKHDDSQHHLVGIRPTVNAARTVEGLRDGRDELLEKALELIRHE